MLVRAPQNPRVPGPRPSLRERRENRIICHGGRAEADPDIRSPACPQSGELFLIDTDAEISLFSYEKIKNKTPNTFKLYAANNRYVWRIISYFALGCTTVNHMEFLRCVTLLPIIGVDLISHYDLLPDFKSSQTH